MAIEDNLVALGGGSAVITAVLTAAFYVLRKMMRMIATDNVGITQSETQVITLTNLRDEVLRLSESVKENNKRISVLEKKDMHMRRKMMEAQVSLLSVEVSLNDCQPCDNLIVIKDRITAVRNKLNEEDENDG